MACIFQKSVTRDEKRLLILRETFLYEGWLRRCQGQFSCRTLKLANCEWVSHCVLPKEKKSEAVSFYLSLEFLGRMMQRFRKKAEEGRSRIFSNCKEKARQRWVKTLAYWVSLVLGCDDDEKADKKYRNSRAHSIELLPSEVSVESLLPIHPSTVT